MKMAVTLLIIAVISACALAAVPQQINYQGYLTRPNGTPLDTTVAMTFRMWNTDGSIAFWVETHPSVTVAGGVFNVRLGQYIPITDVMLGYSFVPLLGITVGNNAEMSPRIPLASVPYSRRVGTVDGAGGGTIIGNTSIGWNNFNTGDSTFVTGVRNSAEGEYNTIGGGHDHECWGSNITIAGGGHNTALASQATISGGAENVVTGNCSVVGGGLYNTAGSGWSTVPGGLRNRAAGLMSFAAGDSTNALGRNSFTLGTRITCAAESAFVWSDGSGPVLSIGSSRTFNVKATNGTRIWSNSDLTAGVRLNAGSSAWIAWSDSTRKRNIRGLDTADILARFASLPLKRWEYKSEDAGVEHIGPMAQDFWNAFHLGDEPLGISTIDADGVMMATMQELCKRIVELQARVDALEADRQTTLKRE